MTDYKILGQSANDGSEENLYSVPASKSAVVRAINVTNTSSTADTFDIIFVSSSASSTTDTDYLFKTHEILGNETITIKGGYTMEENNTLRIKSTNGTSTFHAFGGEI